MLRLVSSLGFFGYKNSTCSKPSVESANIWYIGKNGKKILKSSPHPTSTGSSRCMVTSAHHYLSLQTFAATPNLIYACTQHISVCYVSPIVPFGFLFNVEFERGWRTSWYTKRNTNWLVQLLPEKDKMFSRFSETAKNSPLSNPFSVAQCSSETTPVTRRSRIMAAPNTGTFEAGFSDLRSCVWFTISLALLSL